LSASPGGRPLSHKDQVSADMHLTLDTWRGNLSEVERSRLKRLAACCISLQVPWQLEWLPQRPSTMPFDKRRIASMSDARRFQQCAALATLGERVQARADRTIEALVIVVAVASGYNDSSGPTGEAWFQEDSAEPLLVPAVLSCAEVRAMRCVSRPLVGYGPGRGLWPPCCFVRCALAWHLGPELDSEAQRAKIYKELTAPRIGPLKIFTSGARKGHLYIAVGELRALCASPRDGRPPGSVICTHAPRLSRVLHEHQYPPPLPIVLTPASSVSVKVLVHWSWRIGPKGARFSAPAWDDYRKGERPLLTPEGVAVDDWIEADMGATGWRCVYSMHITRR
jgi:hypothetical protein